MSKAQIEAELQEYSAAGWQLVTRTEYGSTLLRMVHEQDRIATSEACRPANLLRLLRGTLYKNNANFVAWQAQTGQQPAPGAADTPAPVAPEPPSPAAKQVNSQNMAISGNIFPKYRHIQGIWPCRLARTSRRTPASSLSSNRCQPQRQRSTRTGKTGTRRTAGRN